MTIDDRHDASALADGAATAGGRQWILAATVFGLLVAEGCREGGFWPADAFLVALVSVVVLVVAMVLHPPDRRSMLLVGSVVTLALWWLVRSISVETARSFLPLGASILGFGAAFLAVRPLRGHLRDLGGFGVACLGACGSLIGFAGLIWRWYPIAMPAQSLWRLSTTLTYSDAAGLVLAMCLLVAMGVKSYPPLARVTVCLCAGGLLATQSRGAYVAFACACLIVPWRRYVDLAIPLAAGIALGAAAIVSSPEATPEPWLAAVGVITCAISAFASRDIPSYRIPLRARVALLVVLCALVVVAAAGAHHEIGLRALAPSDQDRASEWSAALHQWRAAPLLGVGPERLLTFHASDGTFAHFAHNEYLQIAADAGIIGLALLAAAVVSAARAVRRVDVLSSCAVSALACFAVGGAFDFDWHLSFVGLLGGWCAGLAARRGGDATYAGSTSKVVTDIAKPGGTGPAADNNELRIPEEGSLG
jgi:O-antigen ligase